MYELDHPYYFYLMALIPAMVVIYIITELWKRRARKKFGDIELLQQLAPERSPIKPLLKLVLAMLIIASLSVALVNPKVGSSLETVKREGIDVVFALDVSKSMLAEDARPDRLTKAKQIISRTLDRMVSDRVGIIIYAAQAYPQLPITTDYGAARLFLQTVDTEIIPSQGTAIADAIQLATRYFDDETQKNRIVVILSDGEDHEEGFEEAARQAAELGIKIYTVGIGTEKGAPIPDLRGGVNIGFKRDMNNEIVVSRLNSGNLKKIAKATDGDYINGKITREAVSSIIETIEQMEKKEFESQVFADYEDQFQWFLGLAILLLVLDIFILERKTQWFKRLKLFDDEKSA